jgi:hypothetical protein
MRTTGILNRAGKLGIISISLMIVNLILVDASYAQLARNRFLRDVVAMWRFDKIEKRGFIEDISGNGHHAESINNPTLVEGKFGMAMQFSQKNKSYLQVQDHEELDIVDVVSISAWVKRPTKKNAKDGAPYAILAKGREWQRDNAANYALALHKVFNNMLYFWYEGGFQGVNGTDDGEWHHYVAVVEAQAREPIFYIDGKLKPVEYTDGEKKIQLVANHNPIRIGAFEGEPFNSYCDSTIDELAIFNGALTKNAIFQLMNGLDTAIFSVAPTGKLATTWGTIKQSHRK